MRYVFLTLLIGLLAKDIIPLGDRYVVRGVSEGLALAVGIGWLVTRPLIRYVKRYWMVLAYLATLLLTASVSQRPLFVILQVMSVVAVVLFFIAYAESVTPDSDAFRWNRSIVATAFCLTCLASLALLMSRPQLVFEVTPEGNRFRGLFSEPAMMGAASGLLLGLAVFGSLSCSVRIMGGLAAVPCLYLTGSRTSWGAAVAGLLVTSILYVKRKRAWTIAIALSGSLGVLMLIIADFHIAAETQSRVLRSESIGNLSGRTALWELALKKFWESPILGYGFTTGSDALTSSMSQTLSTAFGVTGNSQHPFSLHSGYVQALLDSGTLGACLYLGVIGSALWRVFRYDYDRQYGAEMYCLVFFTLSNVTDTIIFGAAVSYEVFYWYVSVAALSLVRLGKGNSL